MVTILRVDVSNLFIRLFLILLPVGAVKLTEILIGS